MSSDDQVNLELYMSEDQTTIVVVDADAQIDVPWGRRNLAHRWFKTDPPAPDALTNALGAIDDYLVDLDRDHHPSVGHVVAIGPAAKSIARLEQGLNDPTNPLSTERSDLEEVFRLVAHESVEERQENPGLGSPDDADTITAALCIVLAVVRRYRTAQLALRW